MSKFLSGRPSHQAASAKQLLDLGKIRLNALDRFINTNPSNENGHRHAYL